MATAFFFVLLFSGTARAQSWNEFFKQKETQKKYLLEQIVALKIYAGYLKKGYDLASSGISTVKDIKNGEFSLHDSFISSLTSVSPAIRSHAKVAEIIVLQIGITKAFNSIGSSNLLSMPNQLYVEDVRDKILEECGKDLEELLLVVTSGKMEMTDDERIKRLNKVYGAMKDKSAFTQSFSNQISLLIWQKRTEQQSINKIQGLYEKD